MTHTHAHMDFWPLWVAVVSRPEGGLPPFSSHSPLTCSWWGTHRPPSADMATLDSGKKVGAAGVTLTNCFTEAHTRGAAGLSPWLRLGVQRCLPKTPWRVGEEGHEL